MFVGVFGGWGWGTLGLNQPGMVGWEYHWFLGNTFLGIMEVNHKCVFFFLGNLCLKLENQQKALGIVGSDASHFDQPISMWAPG